MSASGKKWYVLRAAGGKEKKAKPIDKNTPAWFRQLLTNFNIMDFCNRACQRLPKSLTTIKSICAEYSKNI